MKFALTFIYIALFSAISLAQTNSVETDFEQNKSKFKLEKLAMGEDASSGYDYLVYKNKNEIVKIREIWSSSANPVYRAEDYFFKEGKLSVLIKYTFAKKYYKTVLKDRNITLEQVEKVSLNDSKLITWIENGKNVSTTDARWQEKEKEVLEAAKSQFEMYNLLIEEKK